jgi:hypothetical protein
MNSRAEIFEAGAKNLENRETSTRESSTIPPFVSIKEGGLDDFSPSPWSLMYQR